MRSYDPNKVINHLKDPENLTETEMKHVPVIESEDVMTAEGSFEVTVRLGESPTCDAG